MENLVYAIILLPLAGFLINGLFGKKLPNIVVGTLATVVVFASFIIALTIFLKFDAESQPVIFRAFEWFRVNGIQVNFGFQIDQLSLMMVMIITGSNTGIPKWKGVISANHFALAISPKCIMPKAAAKMPPIIMPKSTAMLETKPLPNLAKHKITASTTDSSTKVKPDCSFREVTCCLFIALFFMT